MSPDEIIKAKPKVLTRMDILPTTYPQKGEL
jgi:hypothetical protein